MIPAQPVTTTRHFIYLNLFQFRAQKKKSSILFFVFRFRAREKERKRRRENPNFDRNLINLKRKVKNLIGDNDNEAADGGGRGDHMPAEQTGGGV